MTGRENRKARREAERKARKHMPQLTPGAPPPSSPEPPARQPHPETLAYMAEMRAQADRELDEEFGAEFMAHAREVSDRMARRTGVYNPDHNRAEANRQNAQLSTGPRTEQGKLASSRNSLKHGLSTGTLLIPGEDSAEFESLRDALRREHQPVDTTEQLLVDGMAQSHWLLQRAIRFQNECFTAEGVDEKRLALFLRYGTTHERAFHKALSALLRLQKDRRKARSAPNNGFVSQKSPSSPPNLDNSGFVSQSEGNINQNPPALWGGLPDPQGWSQSTLASSSRIGPGRHNA